MKIGVDAYYLFAQQNDGIGNYVLRLLEELAICDTSNQYYLYTPGITHCNYSDLYKKNSNFNIRIVPGIVRSRRRIWLQSPSLIRKINEDDIQVFFGGGEYFPYFLSKKIIIASAIHDVAFKMVPDAISITNKLFYHLLFPFFIKKANCIFTVSQNSKEEIVRFLKIDNNKIWVIYNGIRVNDYHPKGRVEKKRYILFVGTLQPRKNLANLIRAYAIIAHRIPDKLIIVGARSWKSSEISSVIASLPKNIAERINFTGYLSPSELIQLYQEARLFALLSLHEGFCFPILESISSGTAVLTAPKGAIPEVFQNVVMYANPDSPQDIAECMEKMLGDDVLRKYFEKEGLNHSKKYDISIQAKNFVEAFASLNSKC